MFTLKKLFKIITSIFNRYNLVQNAFADMISYRVITAVGGGAVSASVHAGIPPSPRDHAPPPPRTLHHPLHETMHPPGAEHAGRYGTHPTGMQSCLNLNSTIVLAFGSTKRFIRDCTHTDLLAVLPNLISSFFRRFSCFSCSFRFCFS